MNQGRLSTEFRERTKKFAAATIRLYVKLPKAHDEVRVLSFAEIADELDNQWIILRP